eukprot:8105578-Ditylum_brightwellii.AAC.1
MPTIQMVETRHNMTATTTCSVDTIKNTRQSTSSRLMKKKTKRQRRVSTEMATGITVTATCMAVTVMSMVVTGMVVTVTSMTVTGMAGQL